MLCRGRAVGVVGLLVFAVLLLSPGMAGADCESSTTTMTTGLPATIALVQTFSPDLLSSSPTANTTLAGPAMVGDFLIVEATCGSGTATISGGGVVDWVAATSEVGTGSATLWYGPVVDADETVVATGCTGGGFPGGIGGEFSGISTTDPVGSSFVSDVSGTAVAFTAQTATAGQLYLGGGYQGSGIPSPYTPSSGFTSLPGGEISSGGNQYNAGAYQVIPSDGSYTLSIGSASSDHLVAAGSLFNPAVSGGGGGGDAPACSVVAIQGISTTDLAVFMGIVVIALGVLLVRALVGGGT